MFKCICLHFITTVSTGWVGDSVLWGLLACGFCQKVILWLSPLSLPLSFSGQTSSFPFCGQQWLQMGWDTEGRCHILYLSRVFLFSSSTWNIFHTHMTRIQICGLLDCVLLCGVGDDGWVFRLSAVVNGHSGSLWHCGNGQLSTARARWKSNTVGI